MKRQPACGQRGQVRAVTQQVLDLRGDVERDVGPLGVEIARHRERVRRPVEEVGIAEGDVPGARLDLLADVGQHDLARHREEPPAVDRRDRAVPAAVQAPAGRLRVGDQIHAAVALDVSIGLDGGQARAARHREVEAREIGRRGLPRPRHRGHRPRGAPLERVHQREQRRLRLAADHAVRPVGEEVVGVERRVEAEEAEVRARVRGAGVRGDFHAQAERGVHRHRDGDDPGPRQLLRVQRLHRDVHQRRPVPGALQEGGRPGHREGLMAHLVARHEENVAWLAHCGQSTPPDRPEPAPRPEAAAPRAARRRRRRAR